MTQPVSNIVVGRKETKQVRKMAFGKVALLLCVLHLATGALNGTERHCTGACQKGDPKAHMPIVMKIKLEEHKACVAEHQCPTVVPAMKDTPCVDGKSGEYECSNVDLLSFVPLKDLGSNGDGNDIWGWTDPETDKEYAIVCLVDGTSFVDVSNPKEPQVIGFLPTHTVSSLWRDVKVFNNHAFIVSEASNHGMQVFDLTKLRNLSPGVNILKEDTHYGVMGNTHNIVGNEERHFMYAVGTRTCSSGLHVIDVKDPLNPEFRGCFGEDGYVHDAQCVVYKGPDTRYQGREICFCYNENTLTIVDVENKDSMSILSRVPYDRAYYTHQGWLTEDQTHLLLNDELDELYGPEPHTRSLIWNVEELDKPQLINSFFSEKQASDHNLYIRDNLAYEANYCAGLRILDISNIKEGELKEVGFFDVDPGCNSPGFRGSWSSYPFFKSKTIIVSSIERGLFVLKYTGPEP